MTFAEIASRMFKARVMSWLTNSQFAATIPTTDGGGCVIGVYSNGRRIEPEFVRVPDSPEGLQFLAGQGGSPDQQEDDSEEDSDDDGNA